MFEWAYVIVSLAMALNGTETGGVAKLEVNEVLTTINEVYTEAEPEWLPFEATAYTAKCTGCSGITKSGVDVRNTTEHNGRTVIAVDPKVIPLGTAVEIRLADGTIIEGIAEDIGSAIKGARIDVLHATYDAAIDFGRQIVEVRIIIE